MAVYYRGAVTSASAGHANVEADIAVDDRTVFQIGSITEVLTASLMLLLAEDGLVDIDHR
jgi:CubicO group peptidase (beta-lactamase class C family)